MPIRFDDIGNRLKAFRLGSGLSADEIANRLGISRTALYRFEKGELAKIETLEKLCRAARRLGAHPARRRRRIRRLVRRLFRAHAPDRGNLRAHHRARRPDLLSARLRRLRPHARRRAARERPRGLRRPQARARAGRRADGGAAPAQGELPQAPARHRQPDLRRRDGALPAQRHGRPLRPAGDDADGAPRARPRRGRAFHRA